MDSLLTFYFLLMLLALNVLLATQHDVETISDASPAAAYVANRDRFLESLHTREEIVSAHLLARLLARTDAIENDQSKQLKGGEGVVILEGVGKIWQAEQKKDREVAKELGRKRRAAFNLWWPMEKMSRDGVPCPAWHWEVRDERLNIYRAHDERSKQADAVVRRKGEDIKNLGLVNKDMLYRMKKCFPPVPNPDKNAIALLKRAKSMRKEEDRARRKEARALKKEARMREKEARARRKEERALQRKFA